MGEAAITALGLSKRYRIGGRTGGYRTIREGLASARSLPLRAARSLLRGPGQGASAGTFWALRDVSFEVQPGEVLGIIGRNGAGKSTLLKILSRITYPTEGAAEIRGRVGSLLEVGTGFHPELTGRENIYLNGAILGMRRHEIRSRFDEIASFAEVERFLDTPVKRYSSGMYMRLAFSVAAHLSPEILIVDEVLAVGDAEFQKKCMGKMDDAARAGRTVLFVSHNLVAVERLCTRVLLLAEGRVVDEGMPQRVIRKYAELGGSRGAWHTLQGDDSGGARGFAFTWAEVDSLSGAGEPIRCGDGFTVRIGYRAPGTFRDLTLSASLVNDRNVLVFGAVTSDAGLTVPASPEGTCIELVVTNANLMPGVYTLDIAAGDSIDPRSYEHRVGVLTIEIEPSDVYGHGRLLASEWSAVYLPHAWRTPVEHTTLGGRTGGGPERGVRR